MVAILDDQVSGVVFPGVFLGPRNLDIPNWNQKNIAIHELGWGGL